MMVISAIFPALLAVLWLYEAFFAAFPDCQTRGVAKDDTYMHSFLGTRCTVFAACVRMVQEATLSNPLPRFFSFLQPVVGVLGRNAQFIEVCSWLQLAYMCTSGP